MFKQFLLHHSAVKDVDFLKPGVESLLEESYLLLRELLVFTSVKLLSGFNFITLDLSGLSIVKYHLGQQVLRLALFGDTKLTHQPFLD